MTTDRTVTSPQPDTTGAEISPHTPPVMPPDGIERWSLCDLESTVEYAWAAGSDALHSETTVRNAVEAILSGLDCGRIRVAERQGVGQWTVNQWVKKAILL